jgi:hypothetical protein
LIYRPVIEQESGYKITPHWYGPYTVEGVGSSGRVYYLKDPLGDSLPLPISVLRLKAYFSRTNDVMPFEKFPYVVLQKVNESNVDSSSTSLNATGSSNSSSAPTKSDSEPSLLREEDDDVFGLTWVDPEDAYVPLKDPTPSMDDEEKEVLVSLSNPNQRIVKRGAQKRNSKNVVRYSGMHKNSSKRKGRLYS